MSSPIPESDLLALQEKFDHILPFLTERSIRIWCASEARLYGKQGVTVVSKATGISRPTIYAGLKELDSESSLPVSQVRKSGGGRKSLSDKDPGLLEALEKLISPATRGDPMSPLRWTCKSTRNLSAALKALNHDASATVVRGLLKGLGYSLQSNRKKQEGANHPDRDAQFQHISDQSTKFQNERMPVISVDTKKKELIGSYKNPGQEYAPKGKPIAVKTHDFPDKALGKVSPYGVYDIGANKGWVSVGISNDTAEFAVNSIRAWWHNMGQSRYPKATKLMITADCGCSNGYRTRLWKVELQKLADELGVEMHVCHFPPGTSKWNKIEHQLFSYITKNWRGQPLITRETVVKLISNTTTTKGLKVQSMLDENNYEKGIQISNKQLDDIHIVKDKFHGEWNYVIRPQK